MMMSTEGCTHDLRAVFSFFHLIVEFLYACSSDDDIHMLIFLGWQSMENQTMLWFLQS